MISNPYSAKVLYGCTMDLLHGVLQNEAIVQHRHHYSVWDIFG